MGEDAFGLVIDAVRTSRHLSITLDLFLSAHIAGLEVVAVRVVRIEGWDVMYPRDPSPLRLIVFFDAQLGWIVHEDGSWKLRGICAVCVEATEDLRRWVQERRRLESTISLDRRRGGLHRMRSTWVDYVA